MAYIAGWIAKLRLETHLLEISTLTYTEVCLNISNNLFYVKSSRYERAAYTAVSYINDLFLNSPIPKKNISFWLKELWSNWVDMT